MKLNFFKMQAQGNDYLFFDFLNKPVPDTDFSILSLQICDRHFGVGADGIVLILPDSSNDALMRIFNANGSEAEMCGSALISVISYLSKKTKKKDFSINTKSGVKTGEILNNWPIGINVKSENIVKQKIPVVKVNMGIPSFLSVNKKIFDFEGSVVSMGNPHFVTFLDSLSDEILFEFGPQIEGNQDFPKGINVEFAKIVDQSSVNVKVWERGSGATLACGTGACAVTFSGIKYKLLNDIVKVNFPGGTLFVKYDGKFIFLIGEVAYVFSGIYELQTSKM